MLRGLVFGAAMVVVRLIQGTLIDVWQTHAALISIALLILFLAGVVAWGVAVLATRAATSDHFTAAVTNSVTYLPYLVVAACAMAVIGYATRTQRGAL